MRKLVIFAAIIAVTVAIADAQNARTVERFERGVFASRRGDHDTALALFAETSAKIEREGATDRFFAMVHYNIGVSLYHLRRQEEAAAHLERALGYSNRMHARAHYVLGLVRFELGDLGAAERSLRTSIALSTDDAEMWYDLAFVHLAAKDHSSAKKAFAKAADLNAAGAAASRNNLGVLLAMEGKWTDAVLQFERAAAADRTGTAAANLEKCRRYLENASIASTAAELRFAGRRSEATSL